MRPGLPVNIRGESGVGVDRIVALRERGLVEWAEVQLPRLREPADDGLRADVREAAARMQLPLSLHSETATFAASTDGGIREALTEALRDTIGLAVEVGAEVVTIHPPLADPAAIDGMTKGRWTAEEEAILRSATGDQRQAEGWFVEMVAAVLPESERAGTVMAVENMRARGPVPRLNRAEEIARFVREVDHPRVRICLDVRKAHQQGLDPARFIEANAGWIANVHIAGIALSGKPAGMVIGGVDWGSAVAALHAAAYTGPLIYEGPSDAAEASLDSLRAITR